MKKNQDSSWTDLDVLRPGKDKTFFFSFFLHTIIENIFVVLFLLCGLNFLQTETSIMYISILIAFIKDQLSSKIVAALGM